MRDKSKAKKVVSSDGVTVFYWVNWNKNLNKGFKVIHAPSSMNHSSISDLESGLNKKGYATIVYDHRNSGITVAPAKPESHSLKLYSEDLQRIVEAEGLENPSFVGYSFGFMPIVDYVARTSNAKDITGICSSYCLTETTAGKGLLPIFNKYARHMEYVGSAFGRLKHMLNGTEQNYPDQRMPGASTIEVFLGLVDVPFDEIKRHNVSGLEINKWDIRKQLSQIGCPVLLIYGNSDPMVRPFAGQKIKGMVQGECHIEVLQGTHTLPIVKPDTVLETMDKYF